MTSQRINTSHAFIVIRYSGKKALFKRKPTNTSQESPSSSLSAVRKSFRGEAGQAGDGGKKVNGFSTSDK